MKIYITQNLKHILVSNDVVVSNNNSNNNNIDNSDNANEIDLKSIKNEDFNSNGVDWNIAMRKGFTNTGR